MRIRHQGHVPQVHPTAYVAPVATLVGDVRIGPRARVMYGAVLDAEGSRIEIGEASVICENAVLRASAVAGEQPVLLGDHVFVGPHATLLGCAVDPARVPGDLDDRPAGRAAWRRIGRCRQRTRPRPHDLARRVLRAPAHPRPRPR
ncbi:hypothetical protein OG298_00325 [Streptomyces sp. NBC_01005]|uniref:gamma carbonic anhydrase family protein n=1 Tax=unclassified Streptomyces TaxID=2593676 RepID=UPI002E3350EF|nr:hypothetical protein [Streptomyces sp. NBC_01362]WSW02944.1 hypothetical protein OG298_00325 [Streptomyces sp. NBC_01005]WTC92450.1 hypothetical protein OH736_00320 [Streptomyces sp. NBC_01650]